MLKDLRNLKMTDFSVAMVPVEPEISDQPWSWDCYLINLKDEPVNDVLITTKGYSQTDDNERRSSTLRYYYTQIGPKEAVLLEIIQPELVSLTNEFWISFSLGGYMFDRKFLFVEGSLDPAYLTLVPVLNKQGVMIV
ncbi:MAG: hypothetical protein KA479_02180 [Saprospiraceae bacterium]|nr:hypothetical protein [Saprospiraceae bacterium]